MGTTTSVVSRMKLVHPDLGYDGGSDLHTYMRTIYSQLGDNVNSRVFLIPAFTNGSTISLTHNLGTNMAANRYMLYRGTYGNMVPLTSATTPKFELFGVTDTVGFEKSKCDVYNNSGSTWDLIVVLYQESVSKAPLMIREQGAIDPPSANYWNIYPKSDGKIYKMSPAGVETVVGGGLTPQKIVFGDSPVTVKDGTNYLVDTTAGIVTFQVAAGNSGLLQFGIKNDGSDFTVNKARITCAAATIYVPDLGIVGAGEYLEIDAPIDSIAFDWDGTRWVGSLTNVKALSQIGLVSATKDGLMPASNANLDDATATRLGLKQYLHGTTYNGGNAPTLTLFSGGGSLNSVSYSSFRPYQCQDGSWRMNFSFNVILDVQTRTGASIAVAGVTTIATGDQPVNGGSLNAGASLTLSPYFVLSSSRIACQHSSVSTNVYGFAGDIALVSKPSWAY